MTEGLSRQEVVDPARRASAVVLQRRNMDQMIVSALTLFCQQHGGKCFKGWATRLIRNYVTWHYNKGFIIYSRNGKHVSCVLFCSPINEARIRDRLAHGHPAFNWEACPDADAFLVAEVISSRPIMRSMPWPDLSQRKILTFRRGQLVQLPWARVARFLDLQEERIIK